MDEFTKQYIVTALRSSLDDGGEPLDASYAIEAIAPEALQHMKTDCARFQPENETMIDADPSQAGHDFWLTRNGHGAGFWDGDWPEHGDMLTERSKAYGTSDLYIGDDMQVHLL